MRLFLSFFLFLSCRVQASAPDLHFENLTASPSNQSCSTIQIESPVLNPPRHESNPLWCYIYAAADLLSFKYGIRVSAPDIGIGYDHKSSQWLTWLLIGPGGSLSGAVAFAFSQNLCSEVNFHMEDAEKGVCSARTQVTPTKLQTSTNIYGSPISELKDGAELLKGIDRQLDQKNLVGISYNPDILFMPNRPERDIRGGHSSVIIGRALNPTNNRCEYLIRNYLAEKDIWVYDFELESAIAQYSYFDNGHDSETGAK
jgi:hypothetical protein